MKTTAGDTIYKIRGARAMRVISVEANGVVCEDSDEEAFFYWSQVAATFAEACEKNNQD